ncbi:MAG: hypothetical protein J4F35_03235 [Candidatus Latescibacteria bacterium]|nr:hypothetical protein [Candidatus Latescibacterota bacterium]
MIRVELLGRQERSPWPKALLSVLVLLVCGGLYGIHHFFPVLTGPIFSASSSLIAAAEQETAPQRETLPSPEEVQRETLPSSEEAISRPVEKTAPKPAAQQEIARSSTVQQEETPSPEQETASSPIVQRDQREATSRPDSTPSQASSPQRSTVCHQVMRIDEQVPTGIRVASLNCNSSGEYWLEGTSPSYKVLRMFRLRLQTLPSRVSFSAWQEERTLRFAFQGRFAEQDTPPPAVLSSDQAEQFFGKVARWADASGLDSLSIEEPTHRVLSAARTHQRQKLRGIGSSQQINAFLQQLQQAEEVATLGEVLLMPVTSDERGWVQARLYAAVDIIVDAP